MIHEILQLDILDPEIISACGLLRPKRRGLRESTGSIDREQDYRNRRSEV